MLGKDLGDRTLLDSAYLEDVKKGSLLKRRKN